MHIILDEHGVELNKEEQMFRIKLGGQERSISPVKVTAIHIYKTTQVSTSALLLAAENDIPVLLYNAEYKPVVRIWNSNFSGTGQVRVMQPLFCESDSAMWWCKNIVALKLDGQMHLLLVISYDINDDKCRIKISKELERLGFTRLQFSVFAGTATFSQWKKWHGKLEAIFKKFYKAGDKLYVIPQSEKMFRQTETTGTSFDLDWVMGNVDTLYY